MPLLSLLVPGVPVSAQTRSRTRLQNWKKTVHALAATEQPTLTALSPLRLSLVFFHTGTTDLDTDNIIKPIQDALVDVVYVDDDQVTDVFAAKRDLTGSFRLRTTPPVVAAVLGVEANFVYVVVEEISYSDPLL